MKGRPMPDRDTAQDPIDDAYVRAEAALSDDEARAARRARVLAAVTSEPTAPPAASTRPTRRPVAAPGGWLAAASVVGLSLFLASQLYRPAPRQAPTAPPPLATPSSAAPKIVAAPSPSPPPVPARSRVTAPRPAPIAPPAAAPAPLAPVLAPLNVP